MGYNESDYLMSHSQIIRSQWTLFQNYNPTRFLLEPLPDYLIALKLKGKIKKKIILVGKEKQLSVVLGFQKSVRSVEGGQRDLFRSDTTAFRLCRQRLVQMLFLWPVENVGGQGSPSVGRPLGSFLPRLEQEEGESVLFSGAGPWGPSGTFNV